MGLMTLPVKRSSGQANDALAMGQGWMRKIVMRPLTCPEVIVRQPDVFRSRKNDN